MGENAHKEKYTNITSVNQLPDDFWSKDYLKRKVVFNARRFDNGEWKDGYLLIDCITEQCLFIPLEIIKSGTEETVHENG